MENEQDAILSNELQLMVYPNPSDDLATLSLLNEISGQTEITLYNIQGKQIATLFNGEWPGYESVDLNTSELVPGVYLIRLINNGQVATARVVVAR